MHGYAGPYPAASTLLTLSKSKDISESVPSLPDGVEQQHSSEDPVDLVRLLECIKSKDESNILSASSAATWGSSCAESAR